MGHSSWIDTMDYSEGKMPSYRCPEPGKHETGQGYWMYDLTDQKRFISNLNDVLVSNSIYSSDSENTIVVSFIKVSQGPNDQPVYTFDVEVTLYKAGRLVTTKTHNVVGNKLSKEFWTMDGWNGAKFRASNNLMRVVISDINNWLSDASI